MGVPGVAALLNNIPTVWAVGLAAYIGLVNFDLTTYCSGDPPAEPTLTGADALALMTFLDPTGHTTAVKKFQDFVGSRAWWTFCECDSMPTPAPPAAPGKPTDWPDINPPQLGTPIVGTPCFVRGPELFSGMANGFSFALSNIPHRGLQPTLAKYTVTNKVATGAGCTVQYTFKWYSWPVASGGGTVLRTDTLSAGPGASSSATVTPPAGSDLVDMIITGTAGTGSSDTTFEYDLYCGGALPGVPAGCCSDPAVTAMLDQLLQLVTLIQRYDVPFAYIPGASHVGLTGLGSFAISRLLGMRVHVTAHTSTRPDDQGNPPYVWDQGWMSVMDGNGMIQEKRISQSDFVWFPRLMQEATTFGYSLNPGTTITFEELLAEP